MLWNIWKTSCIPSHSLQFVLGHLYSQMFPSQLWDRSCPAGAGSSLAPPPNGKHLTPMTQPGGILARYPKQPQLRYLLEEQWIYSKSLLDWWEPHPVTESDPRNPIEKPQFHQLLYSFGHYPLLMTLRMEIEIAIDQETKSFVCKLSLASPSEMYSNAEWR